MDNQQIIMMVVGGIVLLIVVYFFVFRKTSILDNFTVKRGRYAPGYDYETFNTTDINQCAEKCENNKNCGNFAFNGKTCFLKNIIKDDAYTGLSDEWNTYIRRSI